MRKVPVTHWILLALFLMAATALPVFADDKPASPPTIADIQKALGEKSYDLDTVWTIVAAFLVMWMQAGFAAVEIGFTRAKNAVNILMKNLLDFAFGSLAYLIIGFGIMFSMGTPYYGTSGFFLEEKTVKDMVKQEDGTEKEVEKSNFDSLNWTNVPLKCKFFFQLVFAATAATIVSGAMAERTKFISYILYSIVISAVIYPVSGHWIWGGGWLANLREIPIDGKETMTGVFDFAGSTVVHSVGGWLALVGAFILGPRIGKYGSDGKAHAIPGHNIPLAALGVFILWFGWFGFNPGSTMGAARNDISHIVCTTNTAGAAGTLAALMLSRLIFGKWDSGMALNGALAGLVGITAPCAWVTIQSSIVIGLSAGILVVLSILFIDWVLKIDDPVGAISVHGVCGAFGTLCVGLFSNPKDVGFTTGPLPGFFVDGSTTQIVNQAIGVGSVFVWCIVTGTILFVLIRLTVGLRVSAEEETEGLDIGEHGNVAYHGFVFSTGAEQLTTMSEPKPALVPPDGRARFTLVVEGANDDELNKVWSDLCQPSVGNTEVDFKAIYPYMTTVRGRQFRFQGGNQQQIRQSLESLLNRRMKKAGVKVIVGS